MVMVWCLFVLLYFVMVVLGIGVHTLCVCLENRSRPNKQHIHVASVRRTNIRGKAGVHHDGSTDCLIVYSAQTSANVSYMHSISNRHKERAQARGRVHYRLAVLHVQYVDHLPSWESIKCILVMIV